MRSGRWFLPETPDVIGQLREQCAITIEGLDAFAAWAGGDAEAGRRLPEIEKRGDAAKRRLLEQVREAFVLPVAAEDLFALSRGIDWVLDYARDLVREAEAMGASADAGIAEMAALLREGIGHLADAVALVDRDPDGATAAADAAIRSGRELEHVLYERMAGLLEVEPRGERISMRELYRRCERVGEALIDVAERVVYAVVKES